MSYSVENGMWRSVFAVPSDIVDLHLKLCGEVPLKVLLALLRYNGGLDVARLSAIVGRSEAVVSEALDYLVAEGIIKDADAKSGARPALKYEYVSEEKAEAVIPAAQSGISERKIRTVSTERRRFERDEINRLAESDETVAWLLQEAQAVLGKTLSASATDTVVALYSYHGMKPDIIMMVLQYCKGIGKAHMGYVEKVAATWIENGIETHEQAEREIQRQAERSTVEGRIKSVFGISDRSLVSSEIKYIHVWTEDFGFDIPLIGLAYERAVEATGKLSFRYINGILTNWHTKGIKKPAEAVLDIRDPYKTRATQPKKTTEQAEAANASTSYDLGELEELLNQGML